MASTPQKQPQQQQPNDLSSVIRVLQLPSTPKLALQSICALNGIPKTGNKGDLVQRIRDRLAAVHSEADYTRVEQMRKSIYDQVGLNFRNVAPAPAPTTTVNLQPYYAPQSSTSFGPFSKPPPQPTISSISNTPSKFPMFPTVPAHDQKPSQGNPNPPPLHSMTSGRQPARAPLVYRPSPFYEIKTQLGSTLICEVQTNHRNTVGMTLTLQQFPELLQVKSDSSMRIMVFCAHTDSGSQDISFPFQSELKVNSADVRANLRGLKNKPGSTRPVDITTNVRLKPSFTDTIDFTYALTQRRYYLGVFLCKTFSVDKLVDRIRQGKRIQKASVIREIASKNSDPDIEATSQKLTLKCPITYMRLSLPCRATTCNHIQCFDATSYLQLQELGPQWLCPICEKTAPFEALAVDEYVREILVGTRSSTEQVEIEPSGNWIPPHSQKTTQPRASNGMGTLIVDDDEPVVAAISPSASYSSTTSRRTSTPSRLPNMLKPATTSIPRTLTPKSSTPQSATSHKRPAPEVIDLTLSDDDEPEPARPTKRQNLAPSR